MRLLESMNSRMRRRPAIDNLGGKRHFTAP